MGSFLLWFFSQLFKRLLRLLRIRQKTNLPDAGLTLEKYLESKKKVREIHRGIPLTPQGTIAKRFVPGPKKK